MTISDPSVISKWKNLKNNRVIKYLFFILYIICQYLIECRFVK